MENTKKQEKKEKIKRAKDYPFEIPDYSYIFINGCHFRIVDLNSEQFLNSKLCIGNKLLTINNYLQALNNTSLPLLSERIPILACGSNASYEQLKLKFQSLNENDVVIPVIQAKLYDFDVVYSSHFAKYGSIPATLQYSPDTTVNIFITYLTESQLKHMHKTEALGKNYYLGELNSVKVTLENSLILNKVLFYYSCHGCLFFNGSHISLSAFSAQNRKFLQMSEIEVLTAVKNYLDRDKDIDAFILENINNQEINNYRTKILKRTAKKFIYKDLTLIRG